MPSSLPRPRLSAALPWPAPAVNLAELAEWGCSGVELGSRDLAQLEPAARERLAQALRAAGLQIAAVAAAAPDGSPGEALRQAIDFAATLGAEAVITAAPVRRGAGELPPDGWLAGGAALAERHAVPLLVVNAPGTWADTGRSFDQLLATAPAAWVGAAFDPAGFVCQREHPFLSAFLSGSLKARVQVLRLADAAFEAGARTALHAGNGEVREVASALLARGFEGYFTICPLGEGPLPLRAACAEAHALLQWLGAA